MRYICLLASVLFACSSTVTGGGNNATGIAGDTGASGSAGAGSSNNAGAGTAASSGTGLGGSSSNNAGAAGTAGSGAAPIDCMDPLPITFSWATSGLGSSFECVNSPCWTADLTWDPTIVSFDEVNSTISISVSIHSSGTIPMREVGNLCALSVPDFTFVSHLKVVEVSTGYQITKAVDSDTWWYWPSTSAVQPGTCTTYYMSEAMTQFNGAWDTALQGIILPCVQPSA